jgi:hypothetical protein
MKDLRTANLILAVWIAGASLFGSSCALNIRPASADKLNTEQGPRDWMVEESLQAAARHPTDGD